MNNTDADVCEKEKGITLRYKLLAFAVFLVIITVIWYLLTEFFIGKHGKEGAAIYGDAFGAVNALFSGLAFSGLICAIFLQSQELRNQRRELRLQRRQLKLQRIELEKTSGALTAQVDIMRTSAKLSSLPYLINDIAIAWSNYQPNFKDPSKFDFSSLEYWASMEDIRILDIANLQFAIEQAEKLLSKTSEKTPDGQKIIKSARVMCYYFKEMHKYKSYLLSLYKNLENTTQKPV